MFAAAAAILLPILLDLVAKVGPDVGALISDYLQRWRAELAPAVPADKLFVQARDYVLDYAQSRPDGFPGGWDAAMREDWAADALQQYSLDVLRRQISYELAVATIRLAAAAMEKESTGEAP